MEWKDNPLIQLANCAESMEIESDSPYSSSFSLPSESLHRLPDDDGRLSLKGNPGPWIQSNPLKSPLLVKHLELNFTDTEEDHQEIDDSIENLTLLTHLTIRSANSLKSFPVSIARLHNLQHLKFEYCKFKQLPVNLELLKMNLTHLTLSGCRNVKSLPDSVAYLSNLTSLRLEYCCDSLEKLSTSLGQLSSLTHLSIKGCRIKYIPKKSVATLSNLTSLVIGNCYYLVKLPPCLGQLASLKHLSLENCWKFLPQSIAALSNITSLHFSDGDCVQEIPASLGNLGSLKHFSLENCWSLTSLPDSMSNLLNLETLSVQKCSSLTELPANLKLTYLELINCKIRIIPRGLVNLRRLKVTLTYHILFANLKDSVNLQILDIGCRYASIKDAFPDLNATLKHLVNLQILRYHTMSNRGFGEVSDHLEGLDELILLDIEDTEINHLPRSIMKLRKLQILMLPSEFRLQTLPFHLNDSLFISVKGMHTRKTWKELKPEIGVSDFPIPQGEYPSIISPPGYLSLQGDLTQWIRDNYQSRFLVKMLELKLSEHFDVEGTKSSIGELPNLTHVFATNGFYDFIHYTAKGIKHLCINSRDIESHCKSLGKLSNLESLELIGTPFPKLANLPVSIRWLSLRSYCAYSVPARIAKLSNLHTLDLSGCSYLTSLPPLNIETLKIKRILKSLPVSLRHLEIVHVRSDCHDKYNDEYCDSDMLEDCLAQLVNLEKLSLTCYHIKFLPSMAGQPNLQVLLLKDCFALKELMPNLEQLVELHTLDISGTRIKFLPDSIIKLSKLQQLIIPKCFTQKLPTNLEEVSIIDDTDRRYYKHIGYYDPDFETISDASDEANDDNEVGSVEGVDKAQTEDPVQGDIVGQACEINDDIAHVPTASRSTMKHISNDREIIWPSSKKRKQCPDAKEEKPNTDSTCLEKPSKLADGNGQKFLKGDAATMEAVEKPHLESFQKSHMEVSQHTGEHIAQPDRSSSSFDFVKACYEGSLVWIAFSLTSCCDQLNESICKKFELEDKKIKIEFLDEDKEWLLMTCVSDLTHALLHTSSSGRKFVRLSVTDKGSVNAGRASEINHEPIIPNKSKSRSIWVSIRSQKENSICNQCAGENTNHSSNRNYIPFFDFCLPHIKPLIEGYIDVKLDGNCGFRVIAAFEYGDEEKWLEVRIDLSKELNTNKDLYKKALGGDEEFERANSMVNWLISPANKMHWFEATCLGLVVATKYQKVFTCWSTECCTYLSLESRLVDDKPPSMHINMARINGNHFIALQMPTDIPLPPLSPLWKWHSRDTVKHWSTSIFKKQLDDYLCLCN